MLHRGVGVRGDGPHGSVAERRRPGGSAGSDAGPRDPAAASTRAASAHGATSRRPLLVVRRSASGSARAARSSAASSRTGVHPVGAVERVRRGARPAPRGRALGFEQRGRRRTRARARPAVRRASPPTSAIARGPRVGGVVRVGIARGTPPRSPSATSDARGCVIGLHSTPPTTVDELGVAADVRTEVQRRGHRRVVHREVVPDERRSPAERSGPGAGVGGGDRRRAHRRARSTSRRRRRAARRARSVRYGDGCVPTYSVGHTVSVASGTAARSDSSSHGREVRLPRREAGSHRDVVEEQQEPRHAGVERGRASSRATPRDRRRLRT